MINIGSKKINMPGWRNENVLSEDALKNIYGQQAQQHFNQKNSSLFVFSNSKPFDLI